MKNPVMKSLAALSVVTLVACGGNPKKVDSLETARAAYNDAIGNEVVVKHAAKELDDARLALAQGDKVWKKEGRVGKAGHYAYIASQKVKIAELIAQRKEDDKRLESMNLERQQVQLEARSAEVDKAKQEALALQQQLVDMQAEVTARGIVATLGDVLFDVGEASLKDTASANIDKIANFMRNYPEKLAIVEGHTDSMGDDDFNLDLSRERAASVRAALIVRGVDASRISTRNLGESAPVADNNTAEGRRKNRRVEIIFPETGTQLSSFVEQ